MKSIEIEKKKLSCFCFILFCTIFLSEGKAEAYVSVNADYFRDNDRITVELIYNTLYGEHNGINPDQSLSPVRDADQPKIEVLPFSVSPFYPLYYESYLTTQYKSIPLTLQSFINIIHKDNISHSTSGDDPSQLS